jgi:ABC-2 type transport system ATP-binding protein
MTIIYTTHYMEEAERLCDRIAIVDHGRIIALDTKEALVQNSFGSRSQVLARFEGPDGKSAHGSPNSAAGDSPTDSTAEFTIEASHRNCRLARRRIRGRPGTGGPFAAPAKS